MNQALLAELQRLTAYPSVTLLMPTNPSDPMRDVDIRQLEALVEEADRRLRGDVSEPERSQVINRLRALVVEATMHRATRAIAICASPEYGAVVHLGRTVRQRVVVDNTFATRDMVADLNRTAAFRVVTVSDQKARLLVGDRHRLAEIRNAQWPMMRDELDSATTWHQAMVEEIETECRDHAVPVILAGVTRTVRKVTKALRLEPIATIAGAHDRTSWAELHQMAWPEVVDWMRSDGARAMSSLAEARSAKRFAGGLDEVWALAHDGRVQLLVVEDDYDVPARLQDGRIVRVDDREAPGVMDDAVDELIEAVMRNGGDAVIVPPESLAHHDHVAAVLRY